MPCYYAGELIYTQNLSRLSIKLRVVRAASRPPPTRMLLKQYRAV